MTEPRRPPAERPPVPGIGEAARASPAAVAALAGWARELAGIVVPVECAGCGRLDVALCAVCAARLAGPPWRCEDAAGRLDRPGRAPLPVWTLTGYTGPVRELVVAWKDRGRLDLTPWLAAALGAAARDVAPALAAGLAPVPDPEPDPEPDPAPGPVLGPARAHGPVTPGAAGAAPLWVVPAPSSSAARRRRGADLVGALATAVACGCTEVGVPATAVPALGQRRGARDQVGLGARDRRSNLRGRVHVRRSVDVPPGGRPVVLVDDVLTTGATLAACDDALRGAGLRVVAGLTLAATPAPGTDAAWRTHERRVTVGRAPGDGPW